MNIPQEQVLVRWLLDCADKEKKVIVLK